MPVRLNDCSLIILAGGKSRRMGRNKARLPVGDTTILDYIANRFTPHVAETLISVRRENDRFSPYRCIADIVPGAGPLAGMGSVLSASTSDWNLIIPCDMPDVSLDVVAELTKGIGENPVVLGRFEGNDSSPFPGLYHRSLGVYMLRAVENGTRSVRSFLSELQVSVISISRAPSPLNLNTANDYERFLSRAASGTDSHPPHSELSRLPRTKRRIAERAELETVQPPEFGKESISCPEKRIITQPQG